MADYDINEFGTKTFSNGERKQNKDPLWEEYAQLEYEVNHQNPTKDPIKISRYNELKKYFDIKKSEQALNNAKEAIKRRIIASDRSSDNNIIYTAITSFKKTNE